MHDLISCRFAWFMDIARLGSPGATTIQSSRPLEVGGLIGQGIDTSPAVAIDSEKRSVEYFITATS